MPSKKSSPKPAPKTAHEWSFEAIGTSWWIGIYEVFNDTDLTRLQKSVAKRIEAFDKTYSRFRPDSLVTAISRQAGSFDFPPDGQPLLTLYRQLYDATAGQMTPLIGQLLSNAGYDANYSFQSEQLSQLPAWDEAMNFTGRTLKTNRPVLLDFGAAGKGYLVDIVAKLLQAAGLSHFCVDAGGDLLCYGLAAPLKIGLENPDDFSEVIGIAELTAGALCGSAGNRRAWAGYNHIMNPQTLDSPRHIKALWVSADTAAWADGLATALFFVSPASLKQFRFGYVIIYADGSVEQSPDFPGQTFTQSS